jgi:hypothetical protein
MADGSILCRKTLNNTNDPAGPPQSGSGAKTHGMAIRARRERNVSDGVGILFARQARKGAHIHDMEPFPQRGGRFFWGGRRQETSSARRRSAKTVVSIAALNTVEKRRTALIAQAP